MRIAIVGSRDFPNLNAVRARVESLPAGTTIVSGGARGVDIIAEETALRVGLAVVSYRPLRGSGQDWTIERLEWSAGASEPLRTVLIPTRKLRSFGQAAFYRNALIVSDSHEVIAFHKPPSSGTAHSIELGRADGKRVDVIYQESLDA